MGGIVVHGIETGRHLLDLLQTDGLIEDTCPACIEGMGHHLVVGTYSRRGQEERILATDAAERDGEAGVMVVVDIVRVDTAQHLLDANRPVVVDTGLLGTFQIGITAVFHPSQGRFVVIKTDGTDGTCRITCGTSLRAGCVLTE